MKKLCVILLSLVFVVSASAQQKGTVNYNRGSHYPRPSRVIVTYGWHYPYYPYYYRPYGFWDPYPYYWYPPYNYYPDSRLDLKIDNIRLEYKDKIAAVRHDKSLSKQERKSKIRKLKNQREDKILEAKEDYYKSR